MTTIFEWLSLAEAVAEIHQFSPRHAQRLIGEALSDGRLADRPKPVVDDPHLVREIFGSDAVAVPLSTGAGAWRRWIEEESIDWATGLVSRPAFANPYRPEISRTALIALFGTAKAKPVDPKSIVSAKPGRPGELKQQVIEAMRKTDPVKLAHYHGKELVGLFGASRTTCTEARKIVLSEIAEKS